MNSIELPTMLFLLHRIILVNLPNTLNIITRRMIIKEINPLQAVQRLLELFIKDDTECFVGRKRFLATSLLIPSTERTAGGVTSLFDDAIMSSWPSLLVEGPSLSFFFSCILQLFIICILLICKCLGLLTPIPALHLVEYDIFLSFVFWAGMDDDVTFFSPFERDLNTLTEICSPLARSCCPIFRAARSRQTLETRGVCEGGKRETELICLLFSTNFCLISDTPCLSEKRQENCLTCTTGMIGNPGEGK